MAGIIATLRSGDWLTRERMRIWAYAVLAASLAGLAFLLATSDGLNDYQGRPLATDFSNVYAAGSYVRDGMPEAPFDPARQHRREQEIFGQATPFYGWHYPPFFLFVAGALATMPYAPALAVWQGATLILYLLMLNAIWTAFRVPPSTLGDAPVPGGSPVRHGSAGGADLFLLLAVAFPAVMVNLGHGHNGFLTAALIGTALLLLDARPVAAGILFGALAYKPQFGLLIPLVLIATGRWRTFTAAAATVALLALVTTLAFGTEVWSAFLASTRFTRVVVLEQGGTGWHKIQSVFSMVRSWGGPVPLAYAVQGIATLAVAAGLVRLWRSNAPFPRNAAALIVGAVLATPYSLDYDMVVLAPAIAFLAVDGLRRGFAPYEKTALALLWLAPLIARTVAEHTLVPLGVFAMLWVFALIMVGPMRSSAGRAAHESAALPSMR